MKLLAFLILFIYNVLILVSSESGHREYGTVIVHTLGDFLSVDTHCTPKMTKIKLNLHSSCPKSEVTTKKCHGYCRSLTNMLLDPPYVSKNCKCCTPITVSHKSHVIPCSDGVNRTVQVRSHVECECKMCPRLQNV